MVQITWAYPLFSLDAVNIEGYKTLVGLAD